MEKISTDLLKLIEKLSVLMLICSILQITFNNHTKYISRLQRFSPLYTSEIIPNWVHQICTVVFVITVLLGLCQKRKESQNQ